MGRCGGLHLREASSGPRLPRCLLGANPGALLSPHLPFRGVLQAGSENANTAPIVSSLCGRFYGLNRFAFGVMRYTDADHARQQ